MSRLDLSTAECSRRANRERILQKVAKGIGVRECNDQARHLLRKALLTAGRQALGRLPREQRKGSKLVTHLGLLYKEVEVSTISDQLGERHPRTLTAVNEFAYLLKSNGHVGLSLQYYEGALRARREELGDDHPQTLLSVNNLAVAKCARAGPCVCMRTRTCICMPTTSRSAWTRGAALAPRPPSPRCVAPRPPSPTRARRATRRQVRGGRSRRRGASLPRGARQAAAGARRGAPGDARLVK